MRSGFAFAAFLTGSLVSIVPAMALQQVILPLPGENTTNAQDPNSATNDPFSRNVSDRKSDFGSFHFNVTSGQDWPGDPWRFNRPQTSTPDAYGSANTPGSEFSNSGLFPH